MEFGVVLFMVNIILDYKICEGSKCAECAYVCPTNVFTIEKNNICIKSPEFCKLCGECLKICPYAALNIER